MALKIVGMKEIFQIFSVTDELGISREMIEIPLGPEHPGKVRKLKNGKYEIIVESTDPLEEWILKFKDEIAKLHIGDSSDKSS
ncbi:MAG: hypothetical protein HY200_06050 [Nitrospirae bacterium]|nr:hypothetical protein [Nitrospirota bacterium]MBI3594505.1 hypothetical protein [Nitrospirota bacterium]